MRCKGNDVRKEAIAEGNLMLLRTMVVHFVFIFFGFLLKHVMLWDPMCTLRDPFLGSNHPQVIDFFQPRSCVTLGLLIASIPSLVLYMQPCSF